MADIKVKLGVDESNTGREILDIETQNTELANTSIQLDSSGQFSSFPKKQSYGLNALCMAEEDGDDDFALVFNNDDYLANYSGDVGLVDDLDDSYFVWGVVPESGELSIEIKVIGENLKRLVVWGDQNADQYPIEAVVDGKTMTNTDNKWTISFSEEQDNHTIIFTKWNRTNYNAVITLIKVDDAFILVSKQDGLKSFESTSQSTAQPETVFYGVVPNTGNMEILDLNGNIYNMILNGDLEVSNVPVKVFINNKQIQSHISSNSEYDINSKVFSIELSDRLSMLENMLYEGMPLNYVNGYIQEKTLYEILRDIIIALNGKNGVVFADNLFDKSGEFIEIVSNINAIETTKTSKSIPYIKGHKYYVSVYSRSNKENSGVEMFFPIVSNARIGGNVGKEWTRIDGFIQTSDVESGDSPIRLDNNNNYESNTIQYKDIFIYDMTQNGFEDKSLDWCRNNLYTQTDFDNMLLNKVYYELGLIQIKEYLQKIKVKYPYLESLNFREVLNKVCETAQLNLYQSNDGKLQFVSARPVIQNDKIPLSIPSNMQSTRPIKDVILKNKHIGVDINVTNVVEEISENVIFDTFNVPLNKKRLDFLKVEKIKNTVGSENSAVSRIEPLYSTGYWIVRKTTNSGKDRLLKINKIMVSTTYKERSGTSFVLIPDENGQDPLDSWGDWNEDYVLFREPELDDKNIVWGEYGEEKFSSDSTEIHLTNVVSNYVDTLGDWQVETKSSTSYRDENDKSVVADSTDISGFNVVDRGEYFEIYYKMLVNHRGYSLRRGNLNTGNTSKFEGNVFDRTVTNIDLSLEGEVVSINIDSSSENSPTSSLIIGRNNTLIQNNTLIGEEYLYNYISQNIIEDYKGGISTGSVSLKCTDVFDIYGNLVKDFSKGEMLQIGDVIRIDKDNDGNSEYKKSNGEDLFFKIIDVKSKYSGVPLLDIKFQELIKPKEIDETSVNIVVESGETIFVQSKYDLRKVLVSVNTSHAGQSDWGRIIPKENGVIDSFVHNHLYISSNGFYTLEFTNRTSSAITITNISYKRKRDAIVRIGVLPSYITGDAYNIEMRVFDKAGNRIYDKDKVALGSLVDVGFYSRETDKLLNWYPFEVKKLYCNGLEVKDFSGFQITDFKITEDSYFTAEYIYMQELYKEIVPQATEIEYEIEYNPQGFALLPNGADGVADCVVGILTDTPGVVHDTLYISNIGMDYQKLYYDGSYQITINKNIAILYLNANEDYNVGKTFYILAEGYETYHFVTGS